MQLRHHAVKLSWTAFDKLLFIMFGVVTLLQIRALQPEEYGLASQLITLQTWIFIITDGSALQAVIQYGVQKEERGRTNLLSLLFHSSFSIVLPLIILLLENPLTAFFKEPRFSLVAHSLPMFCLLSIPRAFCLKLMQRDLAMKNIFFTNLAWFGTMTVLTLWMISSDLLNNFDDMKYISLVGMAMSSVTAVLLSWKGIEFSTKGKLSWTQLFSFTLPQALFVALNNIIRQLDIFIVQLYYGLAAAGIYTSAKMLYRVFETASDAGIALMYPTAVKLFAEKREQQIITIFSKAISLLLILFIGAIIILELGGSSILLGLLGEKYKAAVGQFNVMILGALFLPFFILQSVELAQHNLGVLLRIVFVSVAVGFAVFYLLGKLQLFGLYPLGIVAYSSAFAVQLVISVRKELHFPLRDMFRALPDVIALVRSRL